MSNNRFGHVNYDGLPLRYRDAMQDYIERGVSPGNFLEAVLANDFVHACFYGDEDARRHLVPLAYWVYNECPAIAWGNAKVVSAWPHLARARNVAYL